MKRQIACGLEPLLRVLFEAVTDDALEPRRDVPARFRELRRILFQNRAHRLDPRLTPESPPAAQHLIKDRSERKDVGPGVRRFAAHLFRRHVSHSTEHHARLRESGCERGFLPFQSGGRLRELGKAEVEDLQASFRGEENVLGFEVAVNNAFLVRRGESVRKLDHVVCRFARRKR